MPRYGRIPSTRLTTRNINEHVRLIAGQVQKSLRDPETRQLAVKIVSRQITWRRDKKFAQLLGVPVTEELPCVQAWGNWYLWGSPDDLQCPPRNDLCEIQTVWNFVVCNCRYVFDINQVDTFVTAKYTLEAGGGDCDDATVLFAALLEAIGFDVRARVIATDESNGDWVHIYPLVGIEKGSPKKWIPLDCTVTGAVPGWEYDGIAEYIDFQM
jgi:hypothetical protein